MRRAEAGNSVCAVAVVAPCGLPDVAPSPAPRQALGKGWRASAWEIPSAPVADQGRGGGGLAQRLEGGGGRPADPQAKAHMDGA